MSLYLLHENLRTGSDLDFSIHSMKIPACFHIGNMVMLNAKEEFIPPVKKSLPGNDFLKSDNPTATLLYTPRDELIPFFWKKFTPEEYYFHVHNYCQVFLLTSGKALYFVNNRPVEINTGDLFIINAFIPHTWLALENTHVILAAFNPQMVLFEHYSGKYSHDLLRLMYSEHFPYIHLKAEEPFTSIAAGLFSGILDEYASQKLAFDTIIRMKLFELSIIIIREVLKLSTNSAESDASYKILKKAFDYISEHLKEAITLTDVSNHVCMNPSYFSHYFKKNIGITFTTYLNRQRLSHAAEMLLKTDMPVSAVAFESGFNSISTFYQQFTAVYSVPPTKFKKFSKQLSIDKE